MEDFKDLSCFFPENQKEKDQYVIEGVSTFVYPEGHERAGEPIDWLVEKITAEERSKIEEECSYYETVDKKRIKKLDIKRFGKKFIIASVVFPNMKDKILLDKYKTSDPIIVFDAIAPYFADQEKLANQINAINGIGDSKAEFESIKNKAKNL